MILTIEATIQAENDDEDQDGDLYRTRGTDVEIDEPKDKIESHKLLQILFDGFQDRLKAAGIKVVDETQFT